MCCSRFRKCSARAHTHTPRDSEHQALLQPLCFMLRAYTQVDALLQMRLCNASFGLAHETKNTKSDEQISMNPGAYACSGRHAKLAPRLPMGKKALGLKTMVSRVSLNPLSSEDVPKAPSGRPRPVDLQPLIARLQDSLMPGKWPAECSKHTTHTHT